MTDNSKGIAEAKVLLSRLIEQSEKLVSEVSRLQRDVTSFKTAYMSSETIASQRTFKLKMEAEDAKFRTVPQHTLNDTLESLNRARRSIQNIEADVRSIRSKLDQILQSSYSRSELQELMVDPNDPKRNR